LFPLRQHLGGRWAGVFLRRVGSGRQGGGFHFKTRIAFVVSSSQRMVDVPHRMFNGESAQS
jgi:hypothetical protein